MPSPSPTPMFLNPLLVSKYNVKIAVCVQTMNILIMNQSVIDMCASFLTLLTAVVEVGGTHMSRDSVYDQLVCRFWLTRSPLWNVLFTSSYGILLMTLDRYAAVIHPVWYNNNVRNIFLHFTYRCKTRAASPFARTIFTARCTQSAVLLS